MIAFVTSLEKSEGPKAEAPISAGGSGPALPEGNEAQEGENKKGEAAVQEADKATKELDQKVKAIEGELDNAIQDQQSETVNGAQIKKSTTFYMCKANV